MTNPFVILHLSDSHIGNPKHHPDSASVLRPLLSDLTSKAREIGAPNLIVFSGDLAYGQISGRPLADQYTEAKTWIDQVYKALETDYERSPILPVPGNHDLDSTQVGADQIEWVKSLKEKPSAVEEVQKLLQERGPHWTRILERQAAWRIFLGQIRHPWELNLDLNMLTGVITHGSKRIGIAGLNSSWAASPQLQTEANGTMWIGKFQLLTALEHIEETDFKIAVTHHPTSWLNQAEKNWIEQRIQSKFNVHLHGHEHSQWFIDTSTHLRLEAGACYQGADKENAYSWLKLDFERETADIQCRTYSDRGGGGWIAGQVPDKTDERGCASLIFPSKTRLQRPETLRTSATSSQAADQVEFTQELREYVATLQDRYGFRWERSSFRHETKLPLVYWPIRLRHPTLIHAVQCFAAAGLQRCGCDIALCIDELGHKDYSQEEFEKIIKRWFAIAGGDETKITTHACSELLEVDGSRDIWEQVKQWLGETTYTLDKVLQVSKLLTAETETTSSMEDFRRQRPRRLLTPAVVWTCMLYLHHPDEARPIVTLAGYDEKPLWQAWRDCSNVPEIKVGHLYAPELNQKSTSRGDKPIHMGTNEELAWESREDIMRSLENAIAAGASTDDWLDQHRLVPWAFRECVLLPAWLTGSQSGIVIDGNTINSILDLGRVDQTQLIRKLADELDRWLL